MPRLEKLDESLWLADGETVSFYGFPYPTRSVIVRLSGDRLWVWSPIRLAERVILAHGEWRQSGGRDFVKRALSWLGPEVAGG
jgi:hypothetical protein